MAKRRSWYGWMRKLFTCEAKANPEKKPRRPRWMFRRLNLRQKPATAVVPTAQETRTLDEAAEEQRKHALNVAIATAAAAEAAVAAAKAAAEVVRLAGHAFTSQHYYPKTPDRNLAAIKIQSAFRAYLARKALRALKALVRLQAIVRGRYVRRRVYATLKSLPSNAKLQPETQEENLPTTGVIKNHSRRKHWSKPRWGIKEKLEVECSSQNSWDCSPLTNEDIKAMWLRKHSGMIKRERMLNYSRSHQERRTPYTLHEPIYPEEMEMRSCRMEHWDGSRAAKPTNSLFTSSETRLPSKAKLKTLLRKDYIDEHDSPISFPRRSFSLPQQNLLEDDSSVSNSEDFPPHTDPSESAKAKIRSLSTPQQRVGLMDSWFDNNKNGEDRVSLWTSSDGETKISTSKQFLSGNISRHF